MAGGPAVAKIAFPFQDSFDYLVPEGATPALGAAVEAPLGARAMIGYVVGFAETSEHKLRAFKRVVDDIPSLPEDLIKLGAFIADYYLAPLGDVLRLLVPTPARRRLLERVTLTDAGRALIKKDPTHELKKCARARTPKAIASVLKLTQKDAQTLIAAWQLEGLVTLTQSLSRGAEDGEKGGAGPQTRVALTDEQNAALQTLEQSREGYGGFLLHGVTGSGKTEIYLACIESALQRGKTAIVLVPEIGLTPQVEARFSDRFGGDVVTIHSSLSVKQRRAAWQRVQTGDARVVVGPRSALFAPLRDLGVIIVDEEHDESYKQDETPRYHARDVALMRATLAGCICILGSATPSLESLHNAERGKLRLLTLRDRPSGARLPVVEIVSLAVPETAVRDRTPKKTGREISLLSPILVDRMTDVAQRGEQTILFLNRRGFAPYVLCQACGHSFRCPNCSVSLTHHLKRSILLCHYCAHVEPVPVECPKCQSVHLRTVGSGTERLELDLKRAFPNLQIARLDRDVAEKPIDLHRVLADFRAQKTQILVGTQMVTKGHDFPNVTLVGVVFADSGLNFPDFRAAERTAQQLIQVGGRAGRADKPGHVVVQTYYPEHPALVAAVTQNYLAFTIKELAERKALGYPPFTRLLLARCDGELLNDVRARLDAFAAKLREQNVDVLGPAPSPLERLHGRYRMMLLARAVSAQSIRQAVRQTGVQLGELNGTKLVLDCDPVTML